MHPLHFLAAVLPAVVHGAWVLKDSRSDVPSGWEHLPDEQVSSTHGIRFRFGLAQPGFAALEALLAQTSDPFHPSYGQHLSKQEVLDLSTPPNDTLAAVESWLAANDARSVKWSTAKDSVSAVLDVARAEEMLATRFGVYEHQNSGTRALRTLAYSLPDHIADHIKFVHPTTAFMDPTNRRRRSLVRRDTGPVPFNQSDFASCVNITDPPCVRQIFNIGNYTPQAVHKGGNRIGVAGYLDIWARPDSFKQYINDYIPESIGSNYTFDVVNITGPFDAIVSDEGNIDTQLAIQVAYPIPMTFFTDQSIPPYIPDENQDGEQPGQNEPYLEFIDTVMAMDDPPTVITTSYGDDEQTVPRDYADAVCQGFAKLGARGISVLFSTGDSGLGSFDIEDCIANTGDNATTFLPDFPATCPYVTTVGMVDGVSVATMSASIGSGAGFSNYYSRPAYQSAVVAAYLSGPANAHETAQQKSMYNASGRAYPDLVSIAGAPFFDYYYSVWDIGGGTSVSVPTASSIIALLNDWRIKHGKPTMGFLNPFLYGLGSAGMVDMTAGWVEGCEQPGFNATSGWDPATGLGLFDFGKLQKLALV